MDGSASVRGVHGVLVGAEVGAADGNELGGGEIVGAADGSCDGAGVGTAEGAAVGPALMVGAAVGEDTNVSTNSFESSAISVEFVARRSRMHVGSPLQKVTVSSGSSIGGV
mmetsp:Transcript_10031/g.32206  ORF Transcript_10031/g.32206 Transcript_10031/m.32206 type:complete len:111 (+) Transcript_10031:282-614(+)